MNGLHVLWVALAGGVGAVSRYWVDGALRGRVTPRIPAGTAVINLTGSLLLGVLTGLVMFHAAPSTLTLVAGTGFCGGYTTFSTASFETVRLAQDGRAGAAVATAAVNLLGCFALAGVGLALAYL